MPLHLHGRGHTKNSHHYQPFISFCPPIHYSVTKIFCSNAWTVFTSPSWKCLKHKFQRTGLLSTTWTSSIKASLEVVKEWQKNTSKTIPSHHPSYQKFILFLLPTWNLVLALKKLPCFSYCPPQDNTITIFQSETNIPRAISISKSSKMHNGIFKNMNIVLRRIQLIVKIFFSRMKRCNLDHWQGPSLQHSSPLSLGQAQLQQLNLLIIGVQLNMAVHLKLLKEHDS